MTKTMNSIKKIMKLKNLSQKDLSLIIGSSESSVSTWINGNRTPNICKVEEIANALGYEVVLVKKGGFKYDNL